MRLTFAKGQMKLLVIGAGMMGSAAAFDMARSSGVESVTLADCDIARAQDAARFIAKSHGKKGASVQPVALDAADEGSASALMRGHTGVLSAVPYFFNVHLARAAIGAGCHFAALGGNNTVVRKTLAMGAEAEKNAIGLARGRGFRPMVAFHTSGGTSTMPETFQAEVGECFEKTLRYPNHYTLIRGLYDLGFFSSEKRRLKSGEVSPRELTSYLFLEKLSGEEPDVTIMRIEAQANKRLLSYTMIDEYDRRTGLTSMMRTTAWPASVVLQMIANGAIAKQGGIKQELEYNCPSPGKKALS